jgi:hypothetical protein
MSVIELRRTRQPAQTGGLRALARGERRCRTGAPDRRGHSTYAGSGFLYYNVDGTGATAAQVLCHIAGGPAVGAGDFFVM